MIKQFNEEEARSSAVIYNSTFQMIKKLYAKDPVQAGELAISAIELALTGQFSSDDFMVDMALTTMATVVEKDKEKYEKKIETQKQAKIVDQHLDRIAELYYSANKTQKQIADIINSENQDEKNITQQTISKRISLIHSEYPELIDRFTTLQVVQGVQPYETDTENDNETDTENDNENLNDTFSYFCSQKQKKESSVEVYGYDEPNDFIYR